jgi:hypothetical protein
MGPRQGSGQHLYAFSPAGRGPSWAGEALLEVRSDAGYLMLALAGEHYLMLALAGCDREHCRDWYPSEVARAQQARACCGSPAAAWQACLLTSTAWSRSSRPAERDSTCTGMPAAAALPTGHIIRSAEPAAHQQELCLHCRGLGAHCCAWLCVRDPAPWEGHAAEITQFCSSRSCRSWHSACRSQCAGSPVCSCSC